jgi:hypothetical protein
MSITKPAPLNSSEGKTPKKTKSFMAIYKITKEN